MRSGCGVDSTSGGGGGRGVFFIPRHPGPHPEKTFGPPKPTWETLPKHQTSEGMWMSRAIFC